MSVITIMLPALLLYVAVIVWLFVHFKSKIFSVRSGTASTTDNRLTRLVYHFLDFFLMFIILVLLMMPPLLVVMTISQFDNPEWGIDIGVFSNLRIDLNEFAGLVMEPSGIRNPEFSTQAVISIDTYSLFAYYLFALISVIGGVVLLYILLQLRTVFASLLSDMALTPENSGRIRKIGYAVIVWSLVNPFLQYFGGRAVLRDIAFNVPGFQLNPAFEIPIVGLFTGLVIIVLSGVLNEAARIQKDQELTI